MERRLAAVMFADVVGYTRLVEEDEPGTLHAVKAQLSEIVAPRIAEHKGRIFRFIGDGILVEFPSVVEATACAWELQKAIAQRNADVPESRQLVYRIGINLGDIIIDGPELFGDGVNVAARLESIADPGGIVISASVHEQIKSKLPLAWESLGYMRFKNVRERISVYRLAEPTVRAATAARRARRRLWAIGLGTAAALGVLAVFLFGPLAGDRDPLRRALSPTEFRELLPGSEWGRYRRDGQDWVFFDYYNTHDPTKESGDAYSYYGPCSFPDSMHCLPEVASLIALADFGATHQWRAERFTWQLFQQDDIAMHCILPDTDDEECYSYVLVEDKSDQAEQHRRYTRYKVNRNDISDYTRDGESLFYKADRWDVKDLVSGLVPEE